MTKQKENHDKTINWATIVDLDNAKPLPRFPVAIFPEWLKRFILNVADFSQTAPDAASMTALSFLSAVLAKKFVIKPYSSGSWVERNNLYTVTIMDSGERKSTVHSLFLAPIIARERALQPKDGDPKEDKPMKRLLTDDSTGEKLAVLLQDNDEKMFLTSSEGGMFEYLSGVRNGTPPNLDIYLKSYTGDYLTVDRVTRSTITLYEPILTIGLFTQTSVLEGLPKRLSDRGIFARFLYSKPESMTGKRDVTPKLLDSELQASYIRNIEAMFTIESDQPVVLNLSEDAQAKFLDFQRALEGSLSNDPEADFMIPWLVRLPAQLLRIASLLHIAEYIENGISELPTEIGFETIEKVIVAAHYFTEHAKHAFGCIKSDEELENAKYLWNVLATMPDKEQKNQFPRQEVWKKTKGKFSRAEFLDNALSILEAHGYAVCEPAENTDKKKPGRTGYVIKLNPEAKKLKSKKKV